MSTWIHGVLDDEDNRGPALSVDPGEPVKRGERDSPRACMEIDEGSIGTKACSSSEAENRATDQSMCVASREGTRSAEQRVSGRDCRKDQDTPARVSMLNENR